MSSQDRVRAGLLFDLYGALLTDHQQEVWQLYYLEDWSLAEVSLEHGVSRAAVHDLLDRTHRVLEDYEARLGLLAQSERRRQRFRQLVDQMADRVPDCPGLDPIFDGLRQWADEEGWGDV